LLDQILFHGIHSLEKDVSGFDSERVLDTIHQDEAFGAILTRIPNMRKSNMKSAVFRQGQGLVFENIPMLEIDDDQVLIKVANTGFCGSDHSIVEDGGAADGTVLGHEMAGTVAEIGASVQGVQKGTRVILRPTYCDSCPGCRNGRPQLCSNNRRTIGIGDLPGGFAEFVKAYPQMLIPIPDNVDSQSAALAEPYAVGLHAIDLTGATGGSALVIGAGTIGLTVVKLLKIRGFNPIVISEPVAEKRDLARKFGADIVLDPLSDNLMAEAFQINSGCGFSSVFECSGLKSQLAVAIDLAGPGGKVCLLSVLHEDVSVSPINLMFKEVVLYSSYGNTHAENIQCLKLISEGVLDPLQLISDWCTLDELPDVYRDRINTGQAIKVMLKIGEEF